MKTHLKLSDQLSLPLETVTQKLAWLGVTGSGKTYGASKAAEMFWHAGAQIVILDPVGVWYGMRLASDGKKPSAIDIPIFGGLHGDVPLEKTGGELIADLIVDKGLSAIIDVSQFESDTDKARFATDFADRFFFRKKAKPSAVHLFLEECQEFVPQNPQRGEERMLHAFIRMQKLGRNFGIGSSYISQRPQEVNKKALNMAQTLFVFRTTGTHERKSIEQWIEDKSLDQDIAGDLPKIATGDCHVWSPEFLKVSKTVHILKKETFNASATPEVGTAAKSRQLAPIDLDKVRKDMAATIERAKAQDPNELKKRILTLERELKAKPKLGVYPNPLDSRKITELQAEIEGWKKSTQIDRAKTAEVMKFLKDFIERGQKILSFTSPMMKMPPFKKTNVHFVVANPKNVGEVLLSKAPVYPRVLLDGVAIGNKPIIGGALRMIKVLVSRYPMKLTKSQLATFSKMKPSGGSYGTYMSALKSAGLIETEGDLIFASKAGLDFVGEVPNPPQSSEELIKMWSENLTGGARRMFDVLYQRHPDGFTKEELGEYAEVSPSGGSFGTYLSILRSNGLIEQEGDMLKLSSNLFL